MGDCIFQADRHILHNSPIGISIRLLVSPLIAQINGQFLQHVGLEA
jgi:hypothetical protein